MYQEDCLQTLKRLQDESVDLLLQDPPYGITQNKWDRKPPLSVLWPEWKRVIKPSGAMIFFSQQPFTSELVLSCLDLFRYDLIWYKPLASGFLNASRMPMRNHEHILLFYKRLPTYNPIMGAGVRKRGRNQQQRQGRNYNTFAHQGSYYFDDEGTRFPQSVIEFTNGDRNTESFHPTQKPLDLIRYLVITYSNESDLVFDGYFGSGTTPAACVVEKRQFIGAELHPEYFTYAQNRVRDLQRTQKLF